MSLRHRWSRARSANRPRHGVCSCGAPGKPDECCADVIDCLEGQFRVRREVEPLLGEPPGVGERRGLTVPDMWRLSMYGGEEGAGVYTLVAQPCHDRVAVAAEG